MEKILVCLRGDDMMNSLLSRGACWFHTEHSEALWQERRPKFVIFPLTCQTCQMFVLFVLLSIKVYERSFFLSVSFSTWCYSPLARISCSICHVFSNLSHLTDVILLVLLVLLSMKLFWLVFFCSWQCVRPVAVGHWLQLLPPGRFESLLNQLPNDKRTTLALMRQQ